MTELRRRVERLEHLATNAASVSADANDLANFPGNKNLVAGSGITLTPDTGTLTIAASSGGLLGNRIIRKDFHGVTASDELYAYVSSPMVIDGVSILANTSGDLVVDVRKVPIGGFPATGGDSICASAKPTLTADQTYLDTTLTGWDKAAIIGDTYTFHIDSVTTVTDFEITLFGQSAYSELAYTGALTDAEVGDPVGGSITLSGGDGTYTVDALPVSGTRPAGNGLALVGSVYSDSSGVLTTAATYTWTDRFRSGDGQTLDVPSSITVSAAVVYSTWNPSDKHANITLSNGDMRATTTTNGGYSVRSISAITGKRYFEFKLFSSNGGEVTACGVGSASESLSMYVGETTKSVGEWYPNNTIYSNGAIVANQTNTTPGTVQVYKVAVDATTRKVWIGREDEAWPNSGDPETGSNPTATLSGTDAIFSMATPFLSTSGTYVDLVSDPSDMIGSPPSGFTAGI